MSKVWTGVGAWALEAERAEAEERERAEVATSASVFSSGHPTLHDGEPSHSFPSLKEAATKPKKKKGVTLTLSVFTTGTFVGPGGARREPVFEPKGLTPDEMLCLPTRPRERSAGELESTRLGDSFRNYGYGSGAAAPPRRRPDRGPDFGKDDESRRGPLRPSDFDLPSRADEVDNWASSKKFAPTVDSVRQERYGFFRSGDSSKADEIDNWSFGKKSAPPPPPHNRYSGLGSGFRDTLMSGPDSDRWFRESRGSLSSNGARGRPRLVLDPPKKNSVSMPEPTPSRPSPFGAARPREEVLSERGLDWRKIETEIEMKKFVRTASSQSSRPSSVHSSGAASPVSQVSVEGVAPKPRPRVNPFGDAKPRELILEEKGMDWRKIDMELEHRGIERPETDEEKVLKEEIDLLKKELAKRKVDLDSALSSTEEINTLCGQISQREKELYCLISELDDKVRFGQRGAIDFRPGSGSGRIPFSADRSPSQSGISDDSRNMELLDRPRSRGRVDFWSRQMDGQRGFQRFRDSNFLSSGYTNRSISRGGW
ncbi:LOW QUALITY PROTEIN: eukaryotic translation initiation factor 4B1-like [Phalaenopsis equestris]|uniref:LOW QUALITY PROTEIN: eukaryotic translation initiation factor 4B1-like n=1 Tax=Phalaenopsis equestris TaxID=78828 RepID=UPI0009E1A7B0|nr:LOW QUALITY PROTEIN: eukaryotic translation initiation factor 4B1-like [Phalaenopsis equestris]